MKLNIELYIDGQKVDIVNSEEFAQQFALTYSFSDLYEPDKLTDTYSKTISVPGTDNNNKIFGNIWRIDSDNMTEFNPSLLSTFEICLNGEVWQTGSVQLTEITIDNGTVMYSIVLYGSITRVMSLLLNGDLEDPSNKLLRSLHYPYDLRHRLFCNMMYMMWDGQYYTGNIYLNDYMNYVPAQNGLHDNFDNSKRLTYSSGTYSVSPYLAYSSSVDSGELEFDEWQTGEYRVEYQRPAMRMDKLISQIVSDASLDASIRLDPSFFNSNNPYFGQTYMTLSQYTTDSDEGTVDASSASVFHIPLTPEEDSAVVDLEFHQVDGTYQVFSQDTSTLVAFGQISGNKTISLEFMIGVSALYPTDLQNLLLIPVNSGISYPTSISNLVSPKWEVRARAFSGGYTAWSRPHTVSGVPADMNQYITGKEHNVSGRNTYFNFMQRNGMYGTKYKYTMYQNGTKRLYPSYTDKWEGKKYFYKPFKLDIPCSNLSDDGRIELYITDVTHEFAVVTGTTAQTSYRNCDVLVSIIPIPNGTDYTDNDYYPAAYGWTGNSATFSYDGAVRSNTVVTTKDMFDNTTTQGEILLGYTKLLGCIYDTDKLGNITIMPRNKFFENYRILDWSGKVDYSRSRVIKPLTFDTRNLEMKYNNGSTYYEKKYKGEYGLEYAEKKINTGYQFNSETKQLMETPFTSTVMAADPRYRYTIKDTGRIDASLLDESTPFAALYDREGNTKTKTEGKYNLMFRNGKTTMPYTVYITEDDPHMVSDGVEGAGQYCWLDCSNSIFSNIAYPKTSIPNYTTHYGNVSWDIGYPRISYEGASASSYPSTSTVYSRFWESYISEIYNVSNKIMTCYVTLEWTDMMNFSFCDFVTINGTLWHVNKIINYNPLSDDPTQVELIRVSNIDAYTSGQRYDDIV